MSRLKVRIRPNRTSASPDRLGFYTTDQELLAEIRDVLISMELHLQMLPRVAAALTTLRDEAEAVRKAADALRCVVRS